MKAQRSMPTELGGVKGVILNCIYEMFSLLNFLIPKGKIVSICSVPDFTDNARSLYEYIQTCNEEYYMKGHSFVWHVHDPDRARIENEKLGYTKYPVRFVKKNKIASILAMLRSDYIISTHGLYSMIKLTNSQQHALLFHGMTLKKLGFQYENDVRLGVNQADYYFATSPFFQKIVASHYNANMSDVHITGLPRNDLLSKPLTESQLQSIRTLGNNIILYLPTYRKSNNKNKSNGVDQNEGELRFGGNELEWTELNEVLSKEETTLVIKPHPLEEKVDCCFLETLSNVKVISDEWLLEKDLVLYNLLSVCSTLITDYSGAYIDYLLLDRPILFFLPDFDEYSDSRGFSVENLTDYLPGPICKQFKELKNQIGKPDLFQEDRKRVGNIFHSMTGQSYSRNVFETIFKK